MYPDENKCCAVKTTPQLNDIAAELIETVDRIRGKVDAANIRLFEGYPSICKAEAEKAADPADLSARLETALRKAIDIDKRLEILVQKI